MSREAPLLAQYSSSCSPFEDDLSFHSHSQEDEIGTFLQTGLIVLSQAHSYPENWVDLQNLSTQKHQNIFPRKNRPQRMTNVDTFPSRNNRSNRGARLPPSVRGTGRKNGPSSKKKLVVRTFMYPRGRGASEDDSMAMGDEWGTEKDPGFEDCPPEEMVYVNKKKKKERKTGTQPTYVQTEWSPNHRSGTKCVVSTTPRHTRPPHCRPIKSKSRCSKRETPAPAQPCTGDISTQETTTPAPDSSESSSEEKRDSEMHHTPRLATAAASTADLHPPPSQPLISRAPHAHSSSDSDPSLLAAPLSPSQRHNNHHPPSFHPESSEYSLPTQSPSSEDDVKKKHLPLIVCSKPRSNSMDVPHTDVDPKPAKTSKYKPRIIQNKPGFITVPKRKRSSSAPGIDKLDLPIKQTPTPPPPKVFYPMKPPLLSPGHQRLSQSFSTTDLSEIMRPRRPVPNPPSLSAGTHTSLSSLDDSPIENWNEAETFSWIPEPPKRDTGTHIMPQDVFENTQLKLDGTGAKDFSTQIRQHASVKRIKSLEPMNKIDFSASYDGRVTASKEAPKKPQRKDANFDISRTKSFDFESESEFNTFKPVAKNQPALTSIGYLPESLQNLGESPQHVISLINEMAQEKNINVEVSEMLSSPDNEVNVLPFQMCSSANLIASNYEDSKGKKYRFVLTFNSGGDRRREPRERSQSTLHRIKVHLWSHQDKIKEAKLPEKLSITELKRQEAMYEVYTTEISYKKSLSILVNTFRNDPRLSPTLPEHLRIVSQIEYTHLFSNATAMLDCCKFMAQELRNRVDSSMVIESVTDIFLDNLDKFTCFIPYCKNQYYQTLKYKELMSSNPKFSEVISNLEKNKECHNLDLTSFLMLPVQRITRLPLLISNILDYTPETHPDHQSVKSALLKLQELAFKCDIEAKKLSSLQALYNISGSLLFPDGMRTLPIVDSNRYLVREGEIYRVQWRMRKLMKPEIKFQKVHLILLSDIVIITSQPKNQKNEAASYTVLDYCKRQLLTYRPIYIIKKQPFPHINRNNFYMMARWVVSRKNIPNAFALHMLENHRGREACYLFVPTDATEATRWAQAISPPLIPCIAGEQLYHNYESPQVQAISNYTAQLPDELSMDVGDVVSVKRKMPDGWFEGERMRDGRHGWFPSSHVVEIMNENTRNKNIRKAQVLRRISTLIKYSDIV